MLATYTGWTYDVIGELTLADVEALRRQWESVPPAALSLAVMSGTYREPAANGPSSDTEIDCFLSRLRGV